VFISHAHEDADFAPRLAGDLQQRGRRVWIAPDSIWPGLAQIVPNVPPVDSALRRRFDQLETAMDDWIAQAMLAA